MEHQLRAALHTLLPVVTIIDINTRQRRQQWSLAAAVAWVAAQPAAAAFCVAWGAAVPATVHAQWAAWMTKNSLWDVVLVPAHAPRALQLRKHGASPRGIPRRAWAACFVRPSAAARMVVNNDTLDLDADSRAYN